MITMESILLIQGKQMTMENFKTKYSLANDEMAIKMAKLMITQGKMSEVTNTTKEEDEIEKAIKQNLSIELADEIDTQIYDNNIRAREERNETMDLMSIELDFPTTLEAQEFEYFCSTLNIEETCIMNRRGATSLLIENITALEYAKIANKYKADKLVDTVVKTTDKGVTALTNTVNKACTDVVAPVATIAGKGALNIGKGVAQTLIKTGTGLFNSGAKAVKETKYALETDAEMIRARREIRESTNLLKSWTRNKLDKRSRAGGSGITIK